MKVILLKIFREGVGGIIAFISFIITPPKIKRSAEEQAEVNERISHMSLYQFFSCPFCIKVRYHVRRLNLPLEYRDAQIRDSEHRLTLEKEGGAIKVPCLRIDKGGETTWLYESKDIITFLNQQFDPKG